MNMTSTWPVTALSRSLSVDRRAVRAITDLLSAAPSMKTYRLRRGGVLRILDGRHARIRVISGVVWITEEGGPVDHVLARGESLALEHEGIALAQPCRRARIAVEVPAGIVPPRRIEWAPREGEAGLADGRASRAAAAIVGAIVGAARVADSILTTFRARVDAAMEAAGAAMSQAARSHGPMMISDGYPPRHLRWRASPSGVTAIDRHVNEYWIRGNT